ncbi:MAG: hypothetical protein ABEI99_11585 [Halobaculum sp.]
MVRVTVERGEKVLGVVPYNYPFEGDGRFSRPRCLMVNDHRCANTPGTPDPFDAPCADGLNDCWWEPVSQRGGGGGGGGNGDGGGKGNSGSNEGDGGKRNNGGNGNGNGPRDVDSDVGRR